MMTPTTTPTPVTHNLDIEAGCLRYDRDLLIRQVLAVHAGLRDGTAPAAWRQLLRTARWMDAHPTVRLP